MQRFLASVEPFNHLSPARQASFAHLARELSFNKGQTIFRKGEGADSVWIVREGRVHLMNYLPDGKASAICVIAPKETFCCFSALDGKPYPADAIAMEKSTLVRLPLEAFQECLMQVPAFLKDTLCLFCERLRAVEEKGCMVFEPVEKRIAHVLLGLIPKFGGPIPLTRQEVAELAGTTLETAIRTLSHFKHEGVIESSRGSITVTKIDVLRSLSE